MVAKVKKRLDQLILEQYPNLSRNYVQSLIMQGKVHVNDKIITKAGTSVPADASLYLQTTEPKYVSRAGFKLEKALDDFGIDVHGLVVLDAGISTGGFADCLLQQGAKKIYGIDVVILYFDHIKYICLQIHIQLNGHTYRDLYVKSNQDLHYSLVLSLKKINYFLV
jgi:predicted rRNA methylase YqxC with S4 and FtsJ domains